MNTWTLDAGKVPSSNPWLTQMTSGSHLLIKWECALVMKDWTHTPAGRQKSQLEYYNPLVLGEEIGLQNHCLHFLIFKKQNQNHFHKWF